MNDYLIDYVWINIFLEKSMPYKIGKKNSKGWPILQFEHGKWRVIAHSDSKENAQASIRARHMGAHKK